MSLPFPGEPYSPPSTLPRNHHQQRSSSYSTRYPNQEEQEQLRYISTTTQPLSSSANSHSSKAVDDDDDEEFPRRARVTSVMDRGRPTTTTLNTSRPSSFFGVDPPSTPTTTTATATAIGENGRGDGEYQVGGRAGWESSTTADQQQGGRERVSSFFGLPSTSSSYPLPLPIQSTSSSSQPLSSDQQELHQPERRSSFYGLDSHLPSQSHHQQQRQVSGGDSTSGSYSSHDLPKPKYHQAPYASSRTGSVYGAASTIGLDEPPLAPLFDNTHLQPGTLASLLSHEKTLSLYRANAKKTNDPDIQFEFCTFVMDVVTEMSQSRLSGGVGSGGDGEGDGEKKEKELVAESMALLNKLANRGHVKSQYFLADCYTQGIGSTKGKRDYDKAYPLFVLAGKHGHADACFRAAQCCEHGWGCSKAGSKAVTLLRRAAVLSHPGAMHRLGVAELNGELGLSKRPREGVKWLKRAAELADSVDPPQPISLHELALLSEKGIDNVIFKDEEYAAELLARAAELGYAPSAYKLGECYEYGKMGCPQDSALSIHYYNIAAQQSHREACFALTAWYLVGSPGVLPQSDTEAYLWARKAANMGLAKAEYAVGYFTEVGIGTQQNPQEAIEWFTKAALQGDKRAKDRLRLIPSSSLPPQQTFPTSSNSNNQQSYLPHSTSTTSTSTSKKEKKRESSLPLRPQSVDRNRVERPGGMRRQRSVSQRGPVYQDAAGLRGPSPLSYSVGGGDPYAAYGDGGRGEFRPIQASQARMPVRQGSGSPAMGGGGKEKEGVRERVALKKRQGKGEDKDCVIS